MAVDRVKFQEIVSSQVPRYVREDFPLLTNFLEQYYVSQEHQGGPVDIINNIDQYVKVEELCNLVTETTLDEDLDYVERDVTVKSTLGFSDTNGVIKIDDEIIFYESKTDTVFQNCRRGFSGITTYITTGSPDELTFSQSEVDEHTTGTKVQNLNILFLQQFFTKLKTQFTPGFQDRSFSKGLDARNFIFNSDSFYTSKGTDQSYEILFRALYGEDVDIIRPSQFLLTPSNADYKVTQEFVVEQLQGDPLKLKNLTIFQKETGARGSVTNVQIIPYDKFQYYQISIDGVFTKDSDISGSIFGEFKPNPLTKLLENVSVGATVINVDSTIDFPEFGNIVVDNVDGEEVSIAYSGKTSNQFFNCNVLDTLPKKTDVKFDSYSFAYVGISTSEEIRVRFTSTLKDFKEDQPTFFFKKEDTIQIKSLGLESEGKKSNNWLSNVKSKFKIKETTVVDVNNFTYQHEFFKDSLLREGYSVRYENFDSTVSILGEVTSVNSANNVTIQYNQAIPLSGVFFIENQLLKGESTRYPYISNFVANTQNIYAKFNGDVLVASNSIPNFDGVITNSYDNKITFSASLLSTNVLTLPTNPTSLPDHGFYTGDTVYFESKGNGFQEIASGNYFVGRVDESRIRFARSKADLARGTFLSFNGSVVDASVTLLESYKKNIEPQGLFRKITTPVVRKKTYETEPGSTGIFINGVELVNYKSGNNVFFGDIQRLTMTAVGSDYDIIAPPILSIKDEVGTGATGITNVKGSLERLEVTDTGMGYIKPPLITISGGNGVGAAAAARMISIKHENTFIANSPDAVNLLTNDIIFKEDHKFVDGEGIIYQPRGSKVVAGLTTGSKYYVNVTGQTSIQLHNSRSEAFIGINTVGLTAFGNGNQYFVSEDLKQVVSSIVVTNPGVGYENKQRTIPTVGVNTSNDRVEIANHGYNNKDIVRYKAGTPAISGLAEDKNYYVVKVNEDAFKLAEIGTGGVDKDFFFDNNICVDLRNVGRGSFNYPPITVLIQGAAAVFDESFVEDFQELYIIESPIEEDIITPQKTLAWTDTEAELTDPYFVLVSTDANWLISDDPFIGNIFLYGAEVQPIFRGSIESIDLTNGGVGYGSSEILDFQRQPEISFNSGRDAILTPIINNGQISEVIVNQGGANFNAPPTLEVISETGKFAVLIAQVENNEISNVIVRKGGAGYESGKVTINVIPAGKNARVIANIKAWNVNLFERKFANILEDDCLITENIDGKSLQFSSLYAQRPLRRNSNTLSGFGKNNVKYGFFDITLNTNNEEIDNSFHSPILGWAYDGNPIYGPYGFGNIDGSGSIRRMESGYKLVTTAINRPDYTTFPNGFFVNDYIFTGDGDLDESNGRFCVTPDFPNGVYAYFCTISDNIDASGPFNKFRRPVFPYVIGNEYKSVPNPFNFKSASNQREYDVVGDSWFRNTKFYYTTGGDAGYDYIYNSDLERNQSIDVTATTTGSVDSVEVLDPGTDYAVNDRVVFNSEGTFGRNVRYKVSELKGKSVNNVSLATTFIENVEFGSGNNPNNFIGFTSAPHNFLPRDTVFIDNLSEYYKGFDGAYTVGVSSERWYVSVGIQTQAVTGIQTYIYVSGTLDEQVIRANDILRIENEKLKVLNIDKDSGRIRVLRGVDGTLGVAHSAGIVVRDDPRKIKFTSTGITTNRLFKINRQFYFKPDEAVGVGTADVVMFSGITTVTFSNPGIGLTMLNLGQQQIYIPNHKLALNTPMKYFPNSGTSIEVWSGVENTPKYDLTETRNVFAVPLSDNIIGIATQRVGINSNGVFVGIDSNAGGLLYFSNATGVGSYHSFNTNIPSVLTGRVSQNVVTVATAQTHGINRGDRITIDVNPTTTHTIKVKYDDFNRRIVFDPDVVDATGINTIANTFNVPTNKYFTGDKVIYTSDNPSVNMTSSDMYFVYNLKNDVIKLVRNKSELNSENPTFVNVGSANTATLARINPQVEIQKNQIIKFDLSDSSLAFNNSGIQTSAFDMFLYADPQKINEFYTTKTNSTFEVTKNGVIGVDTNASLTLTVSDKIPSVLFYGLEPDNIDLLPDVKKQIFEDNTVPENNTLNLVSNKFDGSFNVVGVTSDTFDYNIPFDYDTIVSYGSTNSRITYNTSSLTAIGPINRVSSDNNGIGYKSLPGFTSITSATGSGALLKPGSTSIGNIISTKINNIGFGYHSDKTLNAVGNLPLVLELDPLGSFEFIGISSGGVNYSQAPDLVVIDGFTDKQITDLDLSYDLNDNTVTINRNTNSLNNVSPEIIPINNTNGFSISSITYNSTTKIVRLFFSNIFSEAKDWPFKVGEAVLVENIAVGFGTAGKGYNSEDYDYTLFEVTNLDSNLGGSGSFIEYDLTNLLETGEFPGTTTNLVAGSVTPKTFFPTFTTKISTRDFVAGEVVSNDSGVGIVERYDGVSGFLFITSEDDFEVGSIIRSETTGTEARINSFIDFNSTIQIGVGATFNAGWQDNSGVLNDNLQVLPNNEYYQNFSYSLKSRIDYNTWDDPVSSLNHVAGFQKFADLLIDNNAVGIVSAIETEISTVIDLIGEEKLNCFPDYDLASERTIDIGNNKVVSDQVVFENRILIDYFESQGNRVLKIDDFSSSFNSNPRSTNFSVVTTYDDSFTYNKIFTLVQDKELRNRKQSAIVSIIQDKNDGYASQYSTLDTGTPLGFFGHTSIGTSEWGLTFTPNLFEFNNYDVSTFQFSGLDNVTGIGSTAIGDLVSIASSSVFVPLGTETTLLTIPTSERSAKLLVQLQDIHNNYFMSEFSLLHDGTNVEMLQYGDITNNSGMAGPDAFGTYKAEISGSNLVFSIVPNIGTAVTANVSAILTNAGTSGVGTVSMEVTNLSSYYKSIASSGSPTANLIATYDNPFATEYFVVTVHDTTNNEYEMFECNVLDSDNFMIVKYGDVKTNVGLGTVGVTKTSNTTNLVYTPNASINVEVRAFGIGLKNYDNIVGINSISTLNNNILWSKFGGYTGTENDKKRAFALTHDDNPIFQKQFLGNSASVVNVSNNSITIPNHFFVTGEKLIYSYENSASSTANAVGIATTSISGISTDKLPTTVFAVKLSDVSVGLATNAAAALAAPPTTLDITSIGIGTNHKFTSTNQNARALVAIDNMIQAPVTEVDVSTTLSQEVIFDVEFTISGISSFKANDVIKINDELMIIQDIGVGATNNVRVLRAQMGTGIGTHANGTTVELMGGNYNIVDNTINFVEAPFGAIPIGTTTDGPNNLDYSGITTFSTFQGRTFMRSGIVDGSEDTYATNLTFDNIQSEFNGQKKTYRLTQNGTNITGFSTSNAIVLNSNILQEPQGGQKNSGDFNITEIAGVSSITYLGDSVSSGDDPNKATIPRGGIIVSVASTPGFGYQPLVSAGATVNVSAAGTILSTVINNPGSGYRVGVQTVNVGYAVSATGITTVVNIGTATVENGSIVAITTSFIGANLDDLHPPLVIIDAPLPYQNIPLVYSDGVVGTGTGAKVDVTVGQGSSVISFDIVNKGFGYKEGEIVRPAIGGTTGIQTTATYDEFQLTIEDVFRDSFNGFTIGELDVFDDLGPQFDGFKKSFDLTISDKQFSIEVAEGSNINIAQCLIVTINDILQVPNQSYKFNGGAVIEFTEAPKKGDRSKIIFYKGTPEVDVVLRDIVETIKIGDTVQLKNNSGEGQGFGLFQESRTVTGITTLNTVRTFAYDGPGITTNQTLVRPVTWCKQLDDIIVNGQFITKDREDQEPSIFPAAYLTSYVGITSTYAYTDTSRPLFGGRNETNLLDYQDRITLIDQREFTSAIGVATVGIGTTVTSVTITNVGSGYSTFIPTVSFSLPDDINGVRATGIASVTGDGVSSILITNPGSGYTNINPPSVLIEVPTLRSETIGVSTYKGDQGQIVGYAQSAGGVGTLELYIPESSDLRKESVMGPGAAITMSQLNIGDIFVVNNSNTISTTTMDGVYEVSKAYNVTKDLSSVGIGTTSIRRVEVTAVGIGTTTTINNEYFWGEYSWGKVEFLNRSSINALEFTPNPYSGLSTSVLVQRLRPLKFNGYTN